MFSIWILNEIKILTLLQPKPLGIYDNGKICGKKEESESCPQKEVNQKKYERSWHIMALANP